MKCLVIGLGSMGKRRVRCLKALGLTNILGFDIRIDRKNEAIEKYGIEVAEDYGSIDLKKFDLIIVSTPPNNHFAYTADAIKNNIPCFVEASVSLDDVKKTIEIANTASSFVAPSCTLKFHPMIEKIKETVVSEKYGVVTNFTYHCGQYLPDWHPWERIHEFYVSNRETGGAREIVPFELTWLTDIFGLPRKVKGFFAKTMEMGASIEDTYAFSLKFDDFIGSMVVDVVSRYATRSLLLNFENAQLRWNWEDNLFKIYEPEKDSWLTFASKQGKAQVGYNKNIVEDMYINEIKSFVKGIKNNTEFPNNLENDKNILEILKQIEDSDGGFYEKFQ